MTLEGLILLKLVTEYIKIIGYKYSQIMMNLRWVPCGQPFSHNHTHLGYQNQVSCTFGSFEFLGVSILSKRVTYT